MYQNAILAYGCLFFLGAESYKPLNLNTIIRA